MGVDKFDEAVGAIRGLIEAKRRSGSELGIQVNLRVPPGDAKGEFWDYLRSCAAEGLISIDGINAFDSWAGAIKEEDLASAGLAARPMPEKRGPCHRLLTTPVVLADGRVNACACRDVEAELIIGDLKDQSLAQILSGDKLHELIEQHDRGEFPRFASAAPTTIPSIPAGCGDDTIDLRVGIDRLSLVPAIGALGFIATKLTVRTAFWVREGFQSSQP